MGSTAKNHITLYLNDRAKRRYPEFQDILRKEEGQSVSEWLNKQISNKVAIHEKRSGGLDLWTGEDGQPLSPKVRWHRCKQAQSFSPDNALKPFPYCGAKKLLVGMEYELCHECRQWVLEIKEPTGI